MGHIGMRLPGLAVATLWGLLTASTAADAAGDAERGARVYRACAACHALAPGQHMTGPSLARIWNRKAGTVDGFTRYSPALRSSGIIWDATTLDAWLADPKAFLPGNWMTFPGLEDPKARTDLIAFLRKVGTEGAASLGPAIRGMTGTPEFRDLRALPPDQQVTTVRLCGDTYRVTTAAGELPPFWEFNLRFKTDSSGTGPVRGRPVILPAGMLGDRASVIFSDPSEISAFIEEAC